MPPSVGITGAERPDPPSLRVVVVGKWASALGGEAILAHHYFSGLRKRGIEAWLVLGDFGRQSLDQEMQADQERIHYVPLLATSYDSSLAFRVYSNR